MPSQRLDPQPGLGAAVRSIRERQGTTQAALGKQAGLHPTWISHVESGKVNPTWGNARRMAYALGVSVAHLASLAEQLDRD